MLVCDTTINMILEAVFQIYLLFLIFQTKISLLLKRQSQTHLREVF